MGGALGLRTSAHRFPLVTKAFNKFAGMKVPDFGYTTLCIFSNITTGPHRDFHNADQDNAVISLGDLQVAVSGLKNQGDNSVSW